MDNVVLCGAAYFLFMGAAYFCLRRSTVLGRRSFADFSNSSVVENNPSAQRLDEVGVQPDEVEVQPDEVGVQPDEAEVQPPAVEDPLHLPPRHPIPHPIFQSLGVGMTLGSTQKRKAEIDDRIFSNPGFTPQ